MGTEAVAMNASLFMDGVRAFFSVLDKLVYGLISSVYDLMHEIANISIFSNESINEFATRVYTFVGIIMLFKVTFSLISYLVNPDAISDKTNGAGNLVKNIMITLVLIIACPFAFDFLYRAQSAILNDNLIPRLVLGTETDTLNNKKVVLDDFACIPQNRGASGSEPEVANIKSDGDFISVMVFRPFFKVYKDDEKVQEFIRTHNDDVHDYCTNAKTVSRMLKPMYYDAETAALNAGRYVFDYSIFMSTAVGIVVLLMLLSLTLDIAIRTIKLGFLEVFAPLPIISYIDPKSGKDGIFKKWLTEVGKTWASLFIRLVVIFFFVYIVEMISTNVQRQIDDKYGFWVNVFLIIGALMFAKQAPKLIEDIIGVKFDGVGINPLKKIREEAVGGKVITGAGMAAGVGMSAAGGAVAANLINNFKRRDKLKEDRKWNWKTHLGAIGTGLTYGAYNGVRMGYGAGKEGHYNMPKETINAVQKASEDRNLNEALVKQEVSKAPFAKARFMIRNKYTDVIGYQGKSGTTDEMKDHIKALNAEKANAQNRYTSALQSLSRLKDSSSKLFDDTINGLGKNPFERTFEMENGHAKLNSNGGIEWKTIPTYEDFMRNNEISFKNESEYDQFRHEYNKMYNAEMEYRAAYNRVLEINREESKLTSQKEKFDAAKNNAKK